MKYTRVVIRKFKSGGDLLALFPDEPADMTGGISSYQIVGQHGAADYSHCISASVPASEEECKVMLRELLSVGYTDLKIIKRRSYK